MCTLIEEVNCGCVGSLQAAAKKIVGAPQANQIPLRKTTTKSHYEV